jgi:hypothetical protein
MRMLADVKTKSCDDKYPAERSSLACAVVTERQQEVNEKYHKKAGELEPGAGHSARRHGPIQETAQTMVHRITSKSLYQRTKLFDLPHSVASCTLL